MTFPTPYEVTWYSFIAGQEDDLGNDSEDWSNPVQRKVIGWQAARSERVLPQYVTEETKFSGRSITDLDLLVPPEFSYSLRDRCGLPDGGLYEVIGGSDREHGFHGWQPGSVIKLKMVVG